MVTEWPPIAKIAAHSAYEMFSWYKYLIVSLVFSHLGVWSGSLFLIAHFPDLCLLVLFVQISENEYNETEDEFISKEDVEDDYEEGKRLKSMRLNTNI